MISLISIKSPTSEKILEELILDWVDIDSYEATVGTPDLLIRWGSRKRAPAHQELNSARAIKTTSDKAGCRRLLLEHGIAVPVFSEEPPVVGRRGKHRKGRGYFFCESLEDMERAKRKGAVYFAQYYPKTREFRIHIGSGRVILYSEKVKDGEKDPKRPWNKDAGFTFKHIPRGERSLALIELAKKAMDVVELDFGAVDIMTTDRDDFDKAVVCEINTAPALSPYGVTKYCQYFKRMISELTNH